MLACLAARIGRWLVVVPGSEAGRLKVAIITTKRERFHRYLCAEVARRHQVVAVLHPKPARGRSKGRIAHHRESIKKYGVIHHMMQRLAHRGVGWNLSRDVERASERYMPEADAEYERLVSGVAHDVQDVNGEEGIGLIRRYEPDVVLCSGGPIYRAPLIEAAGLMLNYHTGVSPIYNGAGTVFWTFANRQPHMTGGTVMRMSTVVDGGDVLAHHLPAVEAGDTPGSLFMKSIMGGVRLYNEVLDHLAAGGSIRAVPQGRPFLNYYGYEWTVCQTLAIGRFVRQGLCRKLARPEIHARYWDAPDEETARRAMERTLLGLIYDA
jgi:methionyl-tRNA formyltransferase